MSRIQALLDRSMKSWNSSDASKGRRAKLNAPATMDQIHAVEKTINAYLPSDYKSFLYLTNGMHTPSMSGWEFHPTEDIIRHYQANCQAQGDDSQIKADPGVQQKHFDSKWVPIASMGNGDHLCIDYNPAPGGKKGQIVEFLHGGGTRVVKGDTFSAAFEKLIGLMEGQFAEQAQPPVVDPTSGAISDPVQTTEATTPPVEPITQAGPPEGEGNVEAVTPPTEGVQPTPTEPVPDAEPAPTAVPEGTNPEKKPEEDPDAMVSFAAEAFGIEQAKKPSYAKW